MFNHGRNIGRGRMYDLPQDAAQPQVGRGRGQLALPSGAQGGLRTGPAGRGNYPLAGGQSSDDRLAADPGSRYHPYEPLSQRGSRGVLRRPVERSDFPLLSHGQNPYLDYTQQEIKQVIKMLMEARDTDIRVFSQHLVALIRSIQTFSDEDLKRRLVDELVWSFVNAPHVMGECALKRVLTNARMTLGQRIMMGEFFAKTCEGPSYRNTPAGQGFITFVREWLKQAKESHASYPGLCTATERPCDDWVHSIHSLCDGSRSRIEQLPDDDDSWESFDVPVSRYGQAQPAPRAPPTVRGEGGMGDWGEQAPRAPAGRGMGGWGEQAPRAPAGRGEGSMGDWGEPAPRASAGRGEGGMGNWGEPAPRAYAGRGEGGMGDWGEPAPRAYAGRGEGAVGDVLARLEARMEEMDERIKQSHPLPNRARPEEARMGEMGEHNAQAPPLPSPPTFAFGADPFPMEEAQQAPAQADAAGPPMEEEEEAPGGRATRGRGRARGAARGAAAVRRGTRRTRG